MSSSTSLYAYEDEPYWSMCLREYVIPAIVFTGLSYYLVFRVLLPMRRINRPTRRTEEEIAASNEITAISAAAAAASTQSADKGSDLENNSLSSQKKTN